MSVNLIYAATQDRVIGNRGRLPWVLPQDLKRFQQLTMDGVVIMGSVTYSSIPAKKRPLKGRTNIVLSRDPHYKVANCRVYDSLKSAIADYNDKPVWIIGGGDVLKQSMDLADKIYLTLIHNKIAGDTLSPIIDPTVWEQTERSDMLSEGAIRYQYVNYARRST